MKAKRWRSSPPRPGWRSLHAPLRPLREEGSRPRGRGRRPKRFSSIDERARQRVPRAASAVLAAVEVTVLAVLLAGPPAWIHHVEVSGNHRLTAAQVVAAAGLGRPGSVFMVDSGAIQRRLDGSTWVRSASVGARLPDRVSIQVEEWEPVATYRAGAGPAYFVSDQAVALGPAAGPDARALLAIEGPARPAPHLGRPALDLRLLVALVNIQRNLPGLIGQEVQSFTIDGCGDLTLSAKRGWDAQFGRVLTPEEFTSLKDKVAALKSLSAAGYVDYNSPGLQYVNVMNPTVPAVKDRSIKPPPAAPPGGRLAASPRPAGPSTAAAPCG